MKEIPDYRKDFGSYHNSASGATQPTYEHILKLYLRKEYKMNFPFAARPRAGQIVQEIVDLHLGLDGYSPIQGKKQGMSLAQATKKGIDSYNTYQPRDWDDGKDREEFDHFKEVVGEMAVLAVQGLKEHFGGLDFEGEYQRWHEDERIDVPTMLFQDYCGNGLQIDLKCSFPMRNPLKKDGTRSWRNPKPKTEPTAQQQMQQAVYWKATGNRPALLFVTPAGYHIASDENCDALKLDVLEGVYEDVVARWLTIQNLMRAANGNWKNLFGLVTPDYGEIAGRHGSEILKIARDAWRIQT